MNSTRQHNLSRTPIETSDTRYHRLCMSLTSRVGPTVGTRQWRTKPTLGKLPFGRTRPKRRVIDNPGPCSSGRTRRAAVHGESPRWHPNRNCLRLGRDLKAKCQSTDSTRHEVVPHPPAAEHLVRHRLQVMVPVLFEPGAAGHPSACFSLRPPRQALFHSR